MVNGICQVASVIVGFKQIDFFDLSIFCCLTSKILKNIIVCDDIVFEVSYAL